ncbi:MAG: polysaccharide biosynthesis protein [Mesorhizobium sp.]|nr:hypothetical protein [Mesorhizobium sp.]MBN9245632.1 polysaccharide biosynthesis protein [Mesorhizobium sp.]
MKGLFSSIYLISRIASAVLNLIAIAVFTRLSSREVYGEYLIGFAYGFIAYGLAIQWLLAAHFGQQTREHAGRVANAVLMMGAMASAVSLLVIWVAVGFGLLPASVGFGCSVILVGLAVYFLANEIGRSQLRVVPVTIASFLRSGLTLLFGSVALWKFHSSQALLLALSLAHIAAAVPIFMVLRRSIWADGFVLPTRRDYLQIWKYSWPLILAGGAAAVGTSIDRIVLEGFFGAEKVASYGVTLDFIKQSFIIVGESVAISYVSVAKAHHGDGSEGEARAMLRLAFATTALLAAFGIVFFLLLGGPVFGILLGKDYLSATHLVPWFAVANACLILRAYYFAQVIYFTRSVMLELISTLVALFVSIALSFWLIPLYGVAGAAMAFTITQVAALLSVLVAPSTRRQMPVDLPRLAVLALAACGTLAAGMAVTAALPVMAAAAVNMLMISAVAGTLLVRWDMFDAGTIWRRLSPFRSQVAG